MNNKDLTIWIPTFRRPFYLRDLLKNLKSIKILDIAHIIVSDNDQINIKELAPFIEESDLFENITYIKNVANLSAGANFLRAFEHCQTSWLMIVGDDDIFEHDSVTKINNLIATVPSDIAAIKFDSTLFGSQKNMFSFGLEQYVSSLSRFQYADALNNLCLISNWMFRVKPCRKYLSSAYLAYSSKLSHIIPALNASTIGKLPIIFSDLQPIAHGEAVDSWPKAPTWFEMVMTISSFSGFLSPADRFALLRLIFHSDIRRNIAKCLRIQHFYHSNSDGISSWRIHLHLALISKYYLLALLLSLPIIFIPFRFLPITLRNKLGNPGTFDRW